MHFCAFLTVKTFYIPRKKVSGMYDNVASLYNVSKRQILGPQKIAKIKGGVAKNGRFSRGTASSVQGLQCVQVQG